jgi:hypothetical protein
VDGQLPHYQVGDVVNGHRWNGEAWDPVPSYQVGDVVNGYRWNGEAWEPVTDRRKGVQPVAAGRDEVTMPYRDWQSAAIDAIKDPLMTLVHRGVTHGMPDDALLSVVARANYLLNLATFVKVPWIQRSDFRLAEGFFLDTRSEALSELMRNGNWASTEEISAAIHSRMLEVDGEGG